MFVLGFFILNRKNQYIFFLSNNYVFLISLFGGLIGRDRFVQTMV